MEKTQANPFEKIAEKIHTITLSGGGQIVDQLRQLFVK